MARIEFATLTEFALNGNGVPTLQTDQLNVIAHHINAIQMMDNNHVSKNIYQELWPDKTEWLGTINSFNILKLTQQKIFSEESPETIDAFVKSEWKQLNRYNQVGMFGKPCYPPLGAKVLPWVWTYMYKENPKTGIEEAKARGTCNGGPRNGIITIAKTYAACVEQTAH